MTESSLLTDAAQRADAFCAAYGLRAPILMAPMAGACPPALAAAVMQAGGMGGCGALLMDPEAIVRWASDVRGLSDGPIQMNLWVSANNNVSSAGACQLKPWGVHFYSRVSKATSQ